MTKFFAKSEMSSLSRSTNQPFDLSCRPNLDTSAAFVVMLQPLYMSESSYDNPDYSPEGKWVILEEPCLETYTMFYCFSWFIRMYLT